MTGSTKAAIGLGVLCALLAGLLVGKGLGGNSESERYYEKANRVLDAVAIQTAKSAIKQAPSEEEELTKATESIAFAAIAYAVDSDEQLPSPIGFSDKVRPYANSNVIPFLDRFRWTFAEGPSGSLDTQDTAHEIGRLEGKTGVAIGYISGHTAWKPK